MKSYSKARVVEEDGWSVIVDRDYESFISETVSVRIFQRYGSTHVCEYGVGTDGAFLQHVSDKSESMKGEWHLQPIQLPREAVSLIARALLEVEPASERLSNKLESLLDREAGRVDRLIELVSSPVIATNVHNQAKPE